MRPRVPGAARSNVSPRDRSAMLALFVILALVICAICAPLLAQYPPDRQLDIVGLHDKAPSRRPSLRHRFREPRRAEPRAVRFAHHARRLRARGPGHGGRRRLVGRDRRLLRRPHRRRDDAPHRCRDVGAAHPAPHRGRRGRAGGLPPRPHPAHRPHRLVPHEPSRARPGAFAARTGFHRRRARARRARPRDPLAAPACRTSRPQ